MKLLYTLFAVIFLFILHGCYDDNEEYLYPQITACDTTLFSYNAAIAPVMEQYCNGCHGPVAPSANIRTDTYQELVQIGGSGDLYGVVSHSSGYSPMPKNGNKLDECTISILRKWINEGFPEN